MLTLDQTGRAFLENEEGCRLKAYQDRAGVWTIAYGNTYHPDGTPVKEGDVITQEEADSYFEKVVPQYEREVNTIPNLLQHQFNPLVSLCWNIGVGGFRTSSIKRLLLNDTNDNTTIQTNDIPETYINKQLVKEGHIYIPTIAYDFLKWCKDDGSFDINLWHRRWREVDVYLNIK